MSPQGLGEVEIEEAVLGHHISQEPNGRLAQVPLPEEVFLGDGVAHPGQGPGRLHLLAPYPLPRGRSLRSLLLSSVTQPCLVRFPGPQRYGPPHLGTDEGNRSPKRGVSSPVKQGGGGRPGVPVSCLLTPRPRPHGHPPCRRFSDSDTEALTHQERVPFKLHHCLSAAQCPDIFDGLWRDKQWR